MTRHHDLDAPELSEELRALQAELRTRNRSDALPTRDRPRVLGFVVVSGLLVIVLATFGVDATAWSREQAADVIFRNGALPWLVGSSLLGSAGLTFPFVLFLRDFIAKLRATATARGLVLSARLEERFSEQYIYRVQLKITYQVGDTTYTATLAPNAALHNMMTIHERTLKRFAPGEEVLLHFDPATPHLASLRRYSVGEVIGVLIIGSLFYASCVAVGVTLAIAL